MRPFSLLAILVVLVCSLRPAAGQGSFPPESPLVRALQKWDFARSGPLLAVDPARVQPYAEELRMRGPRPGGMVPAEPLLPPEAPFAQILAHYGRQFIRSGSVTAVAPVEMKVLNTKLGAPDIYAGLPRDSKIRLFQASLTPAQWRVIGSEGGIGVSDLKRDQQALFLSILPYPFIVRRAVVRNGSLRPQGDRVTISPELRQRVRLRLNRLPTFKFPAQTRPYTWIRFNDGRRRREGQEFLLLDGSVRGIIRQSAYGAELTIYRPNRLKPSDLAFEAPALDRRISLVPDPEPANSSLKPASGPSSPLSSAPPLTVGALVKRAAAASKLELYADPRAGDLPVWTSGQSARAGDVLRALCLAVTGTFRKVGPALVLTDDREGIGARRCLINEWLEDAMAAEGRLMVAANSRLASERPEKYIGFGPDADMPLPAGRLEEIRPRWGRVEPDSYREATVAELSAEWQARLREEVARGNAMARNPLQRDADHARDDRVRISVTMNLSYLVPGVGVVDDALQPGTGWGASGGAPPADPTVEAEARERARRGLPALGFRAAHVSAATAEEVRSLAARAKERGFTHLWLEIPRSGAKEVLAAAAEACRVQGLALMPVVRLAFRPGDTPEGEGEQGADLNVLGETASAYQKRRGSRPVEQMHDQLRDRFEPRGDWLRIDSRELQAAERLMLEIAAAKGIAGLVLRDLAPPGYANSGKNDFHFIREGWDFGYTPSLRLALLREAGVDPIDLPNASYGTFSNLTDLPFFSDNRLQPRFTFAGDTAIRERGSTLPQRWNSLRHAQSAAWLAGLHMRLQAKAPDLALIVEGRSSMTPRSGRYARWEKAEAVPDFSPGEGSHLGEGRALPAIQSFAHLGWSRMSAPVPATGQTSVYRLRKDDPADFAADASRDFSAPDPAREGFSIDLSDLPADRALEFLRALPLIAR